MNRFGRSYEHDPLTQKVIGAAIEVHRSLGTGLPEKVYESALCVELKRRNLGYARQKGISLTYKGVNVGQFFPDVVIEDRVVLELKSVEKLLPVHEAQLLNYLRLSGIKTGLLINFNVRVLSQGGIWRRSV